MIRLGRMTRRDSATFRTPEDATQRIGRAHHQGEESDFIECQEIEWRCFHRTEKNSDMTLNCLRNVDIEPVISALERKSKAHNTENTHRDKGESK